MTKATLALACVLSIGLMSALRADDDSIAKFKGGIGVIPVSNVVQNANGTVTVAPNSVRGVNPPGQIWVIARLEADVRMDGHIRVQGRGLLLGGGNNIGGTANQSVHATLICSATPPFDQFSTPAVGVRLAPNGDFSIDDDLTPTPPAVCASPVLLIRNAGGAWFAAGIPKLTD
jgi:hypothetical protein